jgi:hypothetical protein
VVGVKIARTGNSVVIARRLRSNQDSLQLMNASGSVIPGGNVTKGGSMHRGCWEIEWSCGCSSGGNIIVSQTGMIIVVSLLLLELLQP